MESQAKHKEADAEKNSFFSDVFRFLLQIIFVIIFLFITINVVSSKAYADKESQIWDGGGLTPLSNLISMNLIHYCDCMGIGLANKVSRYKTEFDEIKSIGVGAYGKVYHVKSRMDGMQYAIKKIKISNLDDINNTYNEIAINAKIRHKNIVPYITSWIEPNFPDVSDLPPPEGDVIYQKVRGMTCFMQMELCQMTLENWLKNRNVSEVSEDFLEVFIRQLICGVNYLHDNNIAHRDIKADNVFVTVERDTLLIQLGDFGTSYMGSTMDDELLHHFQTDMFSCGIILLALATPTATSKKRREIAKEIIDNKIVTPIPMAQLISHMLGSGPVKILS